MFSDHKTALVSHTVMVFYLRGSGGAQQMDEYAAFGSFLAIKKCVYTSVF